MFAFISAFGIIIQLTQKAQAKSLSTDTWMSGNTNGALAKVNEVIAPKC
jgi:hypothetical protein